jgi:hypothetical protein
MNERTVLIELLLAGFFAIACLRAQLPVDRDKRISDFFRLSGRLVRLRRSRWQWFGMVAFMLVLRLQGQLPVVLELMVVLEFALFMAMPGAAASEAHARIR